VWIFGAVAMLSTLLAPLERVVRGNLPLECILLLAGLCVSIISLIGEGGLFYCIYQGFLNKQPTFSEAWHQGKSRVLRMIGLFFILIPIFLAFVALSLAVALRAPESLIPWLMELFLASVVGSFLAFSVCAIIIDGIKVGAAAWTGFLITKDNFLRVLVITGGIYLIHLIIIDLGVVFLGLAFGLKIPTPLTLTYRTYQEILAIPIINIINLILNAFLIVFSSVLLTICYLRFTQEKTYPAIANERQAS
jgi:hypothetical protein